MFRRREASLWEGSIYSGGEMFSQTCKYVLRAASALARHHELGPLRGKVIAEEMDIPLNYLHKILRTLVLEGILTSARGGKGGFRLVRAPREITLMELLRPFDETLRVVTCPFENPLCGVANPCPLHDDWSQVAKRYTAFLEDTTLESLAEEWTLDV